MSKEAQKSKKKKKKRKKKKFKVIQSGKSRVSIWKQGSLIPSWGLALDPVALSYYAWPEVAHIGAEVGGTQGGTDICLLAFPISLCAGDVSWASPVLHFRVSWERKVRVSREPLAFLGIYSGFPNFLRLFRFKTRRFLWQIRLRLI